MRFIPAIAALVAAAACETAEPDLAIDLAVSPTPASVGTAQVRVTLEEPDGAPVPDATVVVTAHPPDGGGTPEALTVDTASLVRPGLWVVEAFPFARPGEWTLEATAELPDGRAARGRHPIRVVAVPGGG